MLIVPHVLMHELAHEGAWKTGNRPYPTDPDATPESWTTECEFFDTAASALQEALTALDARSRDIVTSRWLADDDDDKPTLTALGERYRVSAERIRQLEVAALKRLREMLVPRLGVDHCDVTLPKEQSLIAL